MKRILLLATLIITAVMVGTCRPERVNGTDPRTGLPYPTLEPSTLATMEARY